MHRCNAPLRLLQPLDPLPQLFHPMSSFSNPSRTFAATRDTAINTFQAIAAVDAHTMSIVSHCTQLYRPSAGCSFALLSVLWGYGGEVIRRSPPTVAAPTRFRNAEAHLYRSACVREMMPQFRNDTRTPGVSLVRAVKGALLKLVLWWLS